MNIITVNNKKYDVDSMSKTELDLLEALIDSQSNGVTNEKVKQVIVRAKEMWNDSHFKSCQISNKEMLLDNANSTYRKLDYVSGEGSKLATKGIVLLTGIVLDVAKVGIDIGNKRADNMINKRVVREAKIRKERGEMTKGL